ncbi:unnamed protein product [Ectocarpus sp. 12 AP-2014]
MSRSGAAASVIGRVVGHVSPPRSRVTGERELTAGEQDEIVQIFKLCDVNGDGSVTKSELKDALWSLGQNPTEEETDHIFRQYDADKTGTLDFNEFKLLMTARLTYKNTRAEFEDAFRAIDHNKDGKVDITELNRLMVATGFGLTNQELKEIFGFFHRDGSGKVDMVEFLDYMMDA